MDEKAFITRYLAPICQHEAALGLTDDAALMPPPPARVQRVVSTDMMVEGTHFLPHMPKHGIIHKLIQSNLSDMAAMGAAPAYATLAVALPPQDLAAWGEAIHNVFSDIKELTLLGGDTCRSDVAMLSLTVWGHVSGEPMLRSGAHAGDGIYLSGTLAEPALGLLCWQDDPITSTWPNADVTSLKHAHLYRNARTSLGQALAGKAHSCIDLSDGLADALGRIITAPLGAEISEASLPIAPNAAPFLHTLSSEQQTDIVWAGGEEYELLFTLSNTDEEWLEQLSEQYAVRITKIGTVTASSILMLRNASDELTPLTHQGFSHF